MFKQIVKISFILMVMFFINKAFSKDVAWLENQSGGKIVLTDDKCILDGTDYPAFRRGYGYTSTGATNWSCWRVDGQTIYMVWHEKPEIGLAAEERRYPISNLNFIK